MCTVVELDGLVSVYAPGTQTVHTLSASATAVWRLLDGTRTLEQVAEQVSATYAIPVARARQDVRALVADLRRAGLLDEMTA